MSSDPSCVNCGSESRVRRDGRLTCLDCGASYAVTPTGNSVYSVRVWWFIRIANLLLPALALSAGIAGYLFGDWIAFVLGVAGAAFMLVMDADEIRETIGILRGGHDDC